MSCFHVTLQTLGSTVHIATDVADMLLLQLMHFLMFFIELLQFEGPGTLLADKVVIIGSSGVDWTRHD